MATKKNNLKNMKREELEKNLASLQEDIRKVRFSMEGSKSKNVKDLGTMKKQVARILTEINSYEKRK